MIIVRTASINGRPASNDNPMDEFVATVMSAMVQILAQYIEMEQRPELPDDMGVKVTFREYDISISVELRPREDLLVRRVD